jgi:ABC-type lipoprotein export system ATPase subunit
MYGGVMEKITTHMSGFIFKKDGPIASQIISFTSGVNVFYGLNGVGKSTLLKQMVRGLDPSLFTKTRYKLTDQFGAIYKLNNLKSKENSSLPILENEENSNIWQWQWPESVAEVRLSLEDRDQFFGFPVFVNEQSAFFPEWNLDFHIDQEELHAITEELVTSGYLLAKPTVNLMAPFELIPVHPRFSTSKEIERIWQRIVDKLNTIGPVTEWELDLSEEDLSKIEQNKEEFLRACVELESNLLLNKNNFIASYIEDCLPLDSNQEIYLPSIGFGRRTARDIIYEYKLLENSDNSYEKSNENIDSIFEVNSLTLNYISKTEHVYPFTASLSIPDSWVDRCKNISSRATEIYKGLLYGAPELGFEISDIADLANRDKNLWTFSIISRFYTNDDGDEIPVIDKLEISALSSAQKRWALLSIQMAVKLESSHALTVLLDEPEAALHRTAEEFLAKGIQNISEKYNIQFILSTHSPAFLDLNSARAFEIRNIKGSSFAHEISTIVRENIAELGLHSTDLLRSIKKFLIVEGLHEELILNQMYKRELDEGNVMIIPLRGAKDLKSVIESVFIFEFTEADVFILIDNTKTDEVNNVWNWAYSLAEKGELEEAKKYILDNLKASKTNIENKFLQEFYIRSIVKGVGKRVHTIGLSKADIIEYLDCTFFVKDETWESLKTKWIDSKTGLAFKPWISATYKINFDTPTILEAVNYRKPNHVDFNLLIKRLQK